MNKEQKKLAVGVSALTLAIVIVMVAAITIGVRKQNEKNNSTSDETTPVVIDPITPPTPTESVEGEHKDPDETTDPRTEVEEESAPEIELDIAEKEIESGRKDEPGIVGEVVILPGVKGEDE